MKKVFNPYWMPAKMSNGTKTILVEFEDGKFVVTEENGKTHKWTFINLARYIVKNGMHWTQLGKQKFNRTAIYTREEVGGWLVRRENAMFYSLTTDRVLMKVNGVLYMDGELQEYLSWGDFIPHPMSNLTDIFSGLYEKQQPEEQKEEVKGYGKTEKTSEPKKKDGSNCWKSLIAVAFGCLIGTIVTVTVSKN